MNLMDGIEPLLKQILEEMTRSHSIPFYNQPIFLTAISIAFGGLFLTLISKYIEQRNSRRTKAIEFLEGVASNLNSVLSSIAGHRKRNLFGNDINPELDAKRGDLFKNIFSVRVKSKAYLGSDVFWQQYESIIYEIDHAIFLMKKITKAEDQVLNEALSERKDCLRKMWPNSEKLEMIQEFDNETHRSFYELEKMLWVRANSLVSSALSDVV